MVTALMIAAPASGQGKTTVAAALARLHAREGRRVRCFKCGPDFLDPRWLEAASGHTVDSLDLWINGEEDCARRLASAAADADLVIVEGVMGLFDGDASAAALAQRFDIPVVAVIDAGAMAETFAAVAHGLRSWRPSLPWAGVLANRVGGDRHADMLRDALEPSRPDDGGPWLGHLPRQAALALPERHLGLAMPEELADVRSRLDAAADLLATTPLGRRELASMRLERQTANAWPCWGAPRHADVSPTPSSLAGRRVAVARDEAFAFIYPANLDVLRALGAELTFFSPLAGDALPVCDAVWLPGGYPELHAARLARRADLRTQLASHVAAGKPLWAECGGMMALTDRLVDGEGRTHEMWGLLPGTTRLGRSLAALGPHALRVDESGLVPLRGHSFHWSRFETPLSAAAYTEPARSSSTETGEPIYEHGTLRATWFHPWFASSPTLTARLFQPARIFASIPKGLCRGADCS